LRTGESCPAPSLVSATLDSSIRIVVSESVRSAPFAWYPQMRVWLLNRPRRRDDDAPFRSVSSEYTYDGSHTPGMTLTRQPSAWNDSVRWKIFDSVTSVLRLMPLKRTRL